MSTKEKAFKIAELLESLDDLNVAAFATDKRFSSKIEHLLESDPQRVIDLLVFALTNK